MQTSIHAGSVALQLALPCLAFIGFFTLRATHALPTPPENPSQILESRVCGSYFRPTEDPTAGFQCSPEGALEGSLGHNSLELNSMVILLVTTSPEENRRTREFSNRQKSLCHRFEDFFQSNDLLPRRLVFSPFPFRHRALVHSCSLGKLLLR
jgi:hypothetical protein